jgi:rhamnulokinase
MPARIAAAARELGERPPVSPAETVRCVLDSLAAAYARAVDQAADLTGHAVEAIHVVGGGSRNALLAQLTADLSVRIVTSGPVEATALGNVLVQARAHGLAGDLTAMRGLLARTQPLTRYTPRGEAARWREAEARLAAR